MLGIPAWGHCGILNSTISLLSKWTVLLWDDVVPTPDLFACTTHFYEECTRIQEPVHSAAAI